MAHTTATGTTGTAVSGRDETALAEDAPLVVNPLLLKRLLRLCEAHERPVPAWLKDTPAELERLSWPLSPEQEADPYEITPPTEDVCLRALEVLLSLIDESTPDPLISPAENHSLEILWYRKDPEMTLVLIITPDDTTISSRGSRFDGNASWSGPVESHRGDIERSMSALASA